MISLHENIRADNIAWFRPLFDSTCYHKLYSHRSEEARYFLDELIHYLDYLNTFYTSNNLVFSERQEMEGISGNVR